MPAQARGSISYRASRRTLQKVPSLSQSYRASSPKNQIQDNAHSDAMRPALLASQVVARLKSKLKSKGDDFDVANQASSLIPAQQMMVTRKSWPIHILTTGRVHHQH